MRLKQTLQMGLASTVALNALAPTAAFAYTPFSNNENSTLYDVNDPTTWWQGAPAEHIKGHYPYSDEEYPRKDSLMDDPKETNTDTYGSSSCGSHTGAFMFLKSGYMEKGYSAFDFGHWMSQGNKTNGFWGGSSLYYLQGPKMLAPRYEAITPLRHFRYAYDEDPYQSSLIGNRSPSYHDKTLPDTRVHVGLNPEITEGDAGIAKGTTTPYLVFKNLWKPTTNDEKVYGKIATGADRFIREQLAKGRFITVWVQNHIFMIDGIEPETNRILIMESGGGYKYLDDCLKYFYGGESNRGFYIRGLGAFEAVGISSKQNTTLWNGDSLRQISRTVDDNMKTTRASYEEKIDWDLPVDSGEKHVIRQAKDGKAFYNPDGTIGRVLARGSVKGLRSYAPISSPYRRKEVPDLSLRPGQERTRVRGEKGIIDPRNRSHVYKKPVDEVVAYGPENLPYQTKRLPDIMMAVGEKDKVVKKGVFGRKARDGQVLKTPEEEVIHYSPAAVAFDTVFEPSTELEPGKTETIQEGHVGRKDEQGKLLLPPVTRKIAYGAERIPFTTDYVLDEDLKEGETKTVTEGKIGFKDRQGHVWKDPEKAVIHYGPKRVAFETEYVLDEALNDGQEQTTENGMEGIIDRDGKTVREAKKQVVHYGPKRVAFDTQYVVDRELQDKVTQTVTEGVVGLVDRDGKTVREKVDRVVHYAPTPLPIEEEVIEDPTLLKGVQVIENNGKIGYKDREGKVIEPMVKRVIKKGTKEPTAPAPEIMKDHPENHNDHPENQNDHPDDPNENQNNPSENHDNHPDNKGPEEKKEKEPLVLPKKDQFNVTYPKDTKDVRFVTPDEADYLIKKGTVENTSKGSFDKTTHQRLVVRTSGSLAESRKTDGKVDNDLMKLPDGRVVGKKMANEIIHDEDLKGKAVPYGIEDGVHPLTAKKEALERKADKIKEALSDPTLSKDEKANLQKEQAQVVTQQENLEKELPQTGVTGGVSGWIGAFGLLWAYFKKKKSRDSLDD